MPATERRRCVRWSPLHQIGLRSRAMIFMGIAWVTIGLGVATGASSPPSGVLLTTLPAWLRASVWIATGGYAIYTAVRMRGTSRALGWLMVMPSIRFASYLIAWLEWVSPLDLPALGGYSNGWYIAATYLGQIVLVLICAEIPAGFFPRGERVEIGGRDAL